MSSPSGAWELRTTFSAPLIFVCTMLLLFFGLFVRYDTAAANDAHVAQYYSYLRDVAVMIFVGACLSSPWPQ